MAKPTAQSVKTQIDTHEAICAERWQETINRIKRLEMVNVIRGLSGMNLISADVVEVSPAYDHAEVTSLAAATIVYELTNLFAKK